MKAVRLTEIGRPLEQQEIPIPQLAGDEALVRVQAAGVCHSDAHYRAGTSAVGFLPITPGHEIAGLVEQVGDQITSVRPGDRVCVHYLATCGTCRYCSLGQEQFCLHGKMIGKHRDGGYAEYVAVPARSLVPLPDDISFAHGAVMMCSTATSFHALRKGRLQAGETAAVFGLGGLGMSAIQLARAFGALDVYAVDVQPTKLDLARRLGAIPVDARQGDPVAQIRTRTGGRGVDVALELIGLPQTIHQAVQSLSVLGRAVIVGITNQPVAIETYTQILGKEAEIVGSSDHLLSELPLLFEFIRHGALDLSEIVTHTIPLQAGAVNAALDGLVSLSPHVRTVILPGSTG